MSNNMEWKSVGKVKDAHGLKGELYVVLPSGDLSWSKKIEQCRIGENTYQVEKIKPHKDGCILKCKAIDDRNLSESIKGLSFFIPADLLVSQKGETIYLSEILNFDVVSNSQVLGPVMSVANNGAHDLLMVKTAKGEVMIPFVAEFIGKIDFPNKQILMDLPLGLIEIQTGEI